MFRKTKSRLLFSALALAIGVPGALAQEAQSGFASPVTLSFFGGHTHRGEVAGPGNTTTAAFRAMLYPTLKMGEHWFAYGAIQVNSEPYSYEALESRHREVSAHVLQAYLGYSLVRGDKSVIVKAGQLTSAFGSFPLRYDDSRNWLIDSPWPYGYYYYPVTLYGLPGVEADVVLGSWDARVQFTNSSPSNPRRLWQPDQYPNWTAGAGYTIAQGFRVGVSAFRGAYLHREHAYFFPGEAAPRSLPATAYGTDVQWGRGRWNLNGEAQRFRYAYRAIPDFFETIAYSEAKVNLTPRTYLAGRTTGRWRTAGIGADQAYEFAVGIRPAANQLLKLSYQSVHGMIHPGTRDNVVGVQYVVTLNPPALAFSGK